MRAQAVVLDAFEEPLREAERELPRPERGAAVAGIIYAGVCGTDVHLHAGKMAIPTPVVLGHEAVGRIVAVGDALTKDAQGKPLRQGDLVGWASSIACGACRACLSDEVTLCERRRVYGINQSWSHWPHFTGGWASAIYLHAGTTIVRLPKSVDALEAIALGCAGPTVMHGLRQIEDVSGIEVIVQGSGPVGIAAALLARQRGARRVLMIGGPTRRIDLVRDLDIADAYLDLEAVPEPGQRAERACEVLEDDEGAQVVIECTGVPEAVAEGIDLCRPGGAYLVLGQYTDRGPAQINPHQITRKQLSVVGSWAFSPADYLEYIQALPGLLGRVDLKRLVQVFPLSEAQRALEQVAAGRVLKAALAPVGVHAHG